MTNPWVRERFALTALEYPIPARSNRLDFMLGALTLVALTLLGVTGIVLTQFYDPAPLGAHESVRYVITSLPLVSLVRDIHVWSATGAIALVFTHLAAVFWRRGFRRPREGSARPHDGSRRSAVSKNVTPRSTAVRMSEIIACLSGGRP